jgi:membrane associated rhomboid family serine protease
VIPLHDNVPTRTFPVVTVGIIVVNAIAWFWELSAPGVDYHVVKDGYYPCTVQGPCEAFQVGTHVFSHHLPWWEGTFTSMFLHGSWEHIIGNMLFLWIFGNNIEDVMGRVKFLLFYLAAGIAATALQTFVTLQWASANGASVPNIGASGAIAGVLGAYLVLLPRASVVTAFTLGFFFIIREIPAIWFLGIWFLFQLVEGGFGITHPQGGGGVAFFAHVGGFVFGVLAVRALAKPPPLRPSYP